jgi:hypothetical protein
MPWREGRADVTIGYTTAADSCTGVEWLSVSNTGSQLFSGSVIVEVLVQQMTVQQGSIAKLQSEVSDVLSYLRQISEFLGVQISQPTGRKIAVKLHDTPPVAIAAHLGTSEYGSNGGGDSTSNPEIAAHQSVSQVNPSEIQHTGKPTNTNGNLREVILDAIYKDSAEREKRAKSLVISGIRSSVEEDDEASIRRLFSVEFKFNPGDFKCFRLGRHYPDYIRPLLVTLPSKDDAGWLLANSGQLRRYRPMDTGQNFY